MLKKRNANPMQGSAMGPVASHHKKPFGPKMCIASAVLSGRARRTVGTCQVEVRRDQPRCGLPTPPAGVPQAASAAWHAPV
jgi:hypothetical protein